MKKPTSLRLLEKAGISYQILSYTFDPDDLNVHTIARKNGVDVHRLFKTLICVGNATGPLIAVIPGDHTLDRKALARLSGNKQIELLPQDKLQKVSGYIRGGCCPIGTRKKMPVYMDESAREMHSIWVNAGRRGLFMEVNGEDLIGIAEGEWAEISRPE